ENRRNASTKTLPVSHSVEYLGLAFEKGTSNFSGFAVDRAKSKSGDYLSLHYNGTLFSNGKEFDSSILRQEPFVFQIGKKRMHEGWEKGLLNMCVGERRKLVVPSDLAYGDVGGYGSESANKIKAGATLVYDVELLDILDEDAAAPHMVWGL
ncbi:hypothetical protein ACHAWF_013957, partial [Thalassiosira exigua]